MSDCSKFKELSNDIKIYSPIKEKYNLVSPPFIKQPPELKTILKCALLVAVTAKFYFYNFIDIDVVV